jgi:hypothetical protein
MVINVFEQTEQLKNNNILLKSLDCLTNAIETLPFNNMPEQSIEAEQMPTDSVSKRISVSAGTETPPLQYAQTSPYPLQQVLLSWAGKDWQTCSPMLLSVVQPLYSPLCPCAAWNGKVVLTAPVLTSSLVHPSKDMTDWALQYCATHIIQSPQQTIVFFLVSKIIFSIRLFL